MKIHCAPSSKIITKVVDFSHIEANPKLNFFQILEFTILSLVESNDLIFSYFFPHQEPYTFTKKNLPLNKILILTFSFSDPRETRTIAQGSKFFAATG